MHLLFLAFGVLVVVLTYIWHGNELGHKLANFPFVLKAEEERVFSDKNRHPARTDIENYRSAAEMGPIFPQDERRATERTAVTVRPVSFAPSAIQVNIDPSTITNQVISSVRSQSAAPAGTLTRPDSGTVHDYTRM